MADLMASGGFDREQTSERVKEATLARARRGLWNGGQLLGYDLDANRKGYLKPNEEEKVLVNLAFDSYLEYGSILTTATTLNSHGYRTKAFTTRTDRFRPAKEFCYSSVKQMLTNHSYIGKKEINKRGKPRDQEQLTENERYQVVDAVWEPIVDEEKFWAVQELMEKNCRTKHNQARAIKHNYVLNSGLLWCERCGEEMEGRSGTGKKGKRYYYYICRNKDCGFKVSADEIEDLVTDRIKRLSSSDDLISSIVKGTNNRLQKELPQLKEQRKLLQKELDEIRHFADGIMSKWAELASEGSSLFLNDKLEELGKRRKEIEGGVESLELMIAEIERESVSRELVMLALNKFTGVFDHIQPHRQKDLVRHVLHKAVVSETSIKIALYGRPLTFEHFSPSVTVPHFQTATRGTRHYNHRQYRCNCRHPRRQQCRKSQSDNEPSESILRQDPLRSE